VDRLRAGDYLRYTIDVRVAGTYAIEPRVAGIGAGGVLEVQFWTNGVNYTSTPPLTVLTTNWTNLTYKLLGLAAGTNDLRVVMLTNGTPGEHVCRFNYLSIYPAWNEGVRNLVTTVEVTGLTNGTGDEWFEATNNAACIQAALNSLNSLDPTNGGTVTLPAGIYLVGQAVPDETKNAQHNGAVYIPRNNVEIRGAGKTNTVLKGHNRATTLIYVGFDPFVDPQAFVARTNFTLRDLTLEGRPHLVAVTNTSSATPKQAFTNYWETGALSTPGSTDLGSTMACIGGPVRGRFSENILLTNCLFRNPAYQSIVIPLRVSNCLVRACDFVLRDGTNGAYPFPRSVTHPMLTTSNDPPINVGIFVRYGGSYNINVIENTFSGNPSLLTVNTNYQADAADGFVWVQHGANAFVARNLITNNALEGVQFNCGPVGVVQNDFRTVVSGASTVALNAYALTNYPGPTAQTPDLFYSFVGNSVEGNRYAISGWFNQNYDFHTNTWTYALNCCGNSVALSKALDLAEDYPGALSRTAWAEHLNVSGNTLQAGGHGVTLMRECTNVVVLKNDFSAATHRSLSYDDENSGGYLTRAVIAKNILGQGDSFHAKVAWPDSPTYFLLRNTYQCGMNPVSPFLDAATSPVHVVP
jgi:hypothetical protein